MAKDIDGTVLGFEEGRLWLPAHVLGEVCESEVYSRPQQQALPSSSPPQPFPVFHNRSLPKPRWKTHQKPRSHPNRSSGGPGMQAIFLDSGGRSCGTGFFLPRSAGTDLQPNKKPGCSPVLVPARVVQALNLNVHAIGSPITPQREPRDEVNDCRSHSIDNKDGDNVQDNSSPFHYSLSKSRSSSPSPEIFLPKEWRY